MIYKFNVFARISDVIYFLIIYPKLSTGTVCIPAVCAIPILYAWSIWELIPTAIAIPLSLQCFTKDATILFSSFLVLTDVKFSAQVPMPVTPLGITVSRIYFCVSVIVKVISGIIIWKFLTLIFILVIYLKNIQDLDTYKNPVLKFVRKYKLLYNHLQLN